MFDNQFFSELPASPILAMQKICDEVIAFDKTKNNEQRMKSYESYLDALSHFYRWAEAHRLHRLEFPNMTPNKLANINRIVEFFYELKNNTEKCILDFSAKKSDKNGGHPYKPLIEDLFFSEFSASERRKIQSLINQIRTILTESNEFEERHQASMLKSLENLQVALHNGVTSWRQRFSDFF
jgi:hypothetical protein